MNITVLTIFPEIINDYCNKSLLGKALNKELWELKTVNIRDYSENKHKKIDDTPYGGEQGLIMRADVLGKVIESNKDNNTKIIYFTPRGKKFEQKDIKNIYDSKKNLLLICGRYEGIDERIVDEYDIEEYSIGDFVIMGGELPALMLIEGIVRCLDDVIGNFKSIEEDSFGGISNNNFNYLLEYPLYTKPEIWKNRKIPEVLKSGDHQKIKEWKLEMAKKITEKRRPDLWEMYLKLTENKICNEE